MKVIAENKYTTVSAVDEPTHGNACHEYLISGFPVPGSVEAVTLKSINFQNGPIKEAGVNGIMNEDLLQILIHRMKGFQSGLYACRENALALTKMEEALMWLQNRTAGRESRGVEGTHEK